MHSLQRLVKIGMYYPTGHSALAKATVNLKRDLRKVAGENRSIHFIVQDDCLYLEDVELDKEHLFTREFMGMLRSLGIDGLEIDSEIEGDEITSFLQKMLKCYARTKTSQRFNRIDLDDLSRSVRITQKEFLATGDSSAPSGGNRFAGEVQSIDQLLESLRRKGIGESQLSQCRSIIESLSAAALADESPQLAISQVSWGDIEQLLIRITREDAAAVKGAASHESLNSFAAILHALEKHTTTKKSQEAIRLLVSLVQQQPLEGDQGQEKTISNQTGARAAFCLQVSQIEQYISTNRLEKRQLARLLAPDRREELSILLPLLGVEHSPIVESRIGQILRDILTSPLQEQEWGLLVGATKQMIRYDNLVKLPYILKWILLPLRRSEHRSTLNLFNQVARLCNSEEQKYLWPFMVNEVIHISNQESPTDFQQILDLAATLSTEDIVRALPILEQLDNFTEKKISPDLCSSLSPNHYPLFSILLSTSLKGQLAPRLIKEFAANPPCWIMEAVCPFLVGENQLHLKFLGSYLQQPIVGKPTRSTRQLAGQIVAESLMTLPREHQSAPFVLRAISAMADLETDKTHETLGAIANSKVLFIIPAWPSACRKAAADAHKKLHRKKRQKVKTQ